MNSNRIVMITVVVSVAIHLAIYVALAAKVARQAVHGEAMTISFEAITPVQHEETPIPLPRRKNKADLPTKKPEPVAQPVSTPPPSSAQPPTTAGDPNAIATATGAYIQQIAKLLNQNKVFPRESVAREEEGRVMIGLTLGRDGGLLDAKVEEHSAFERLNEAAMKTVHGVAHFPPIPELVPAPLHLHVPLLFQIERR